MEKKNTKKTTAKKTTKKTAKKTAVKRTKPVIKTTQIMLCDGKKYDVIIQRSNRRTVSIKIEKDLKINIKVPSRMTEEDVTRSLNKYIEWIKIHYEKVSNNKEKAEEAGYYIDEEIDKMKKELKKKLNVLLPEYASKMGVKYNRVFVKCQKTRWGSCSSKGNLNFNCLLIDAPESVQRYVVVHELSHLKQMNHSKKFWAIVEKYYPNYREQEKWIKSSGKILMMRKKR